MCEEKSFLSGLELEFVVFSGVKQSYFGVPDRFNPSLELEFFVFSGVKQSYSGETASSIPCFLLDIETWHTSTGTHLSSQC